LPLIFNEVDWQIGIHRLSAVCRRRPRLAAGMKGAECENCCTDKRWSGFEFHDRITLVNDCDTAAGTWPDSARLSTAKTGTKAETPRSAIRVGAIFDFIMVSVDA